MIPIIGENTKPKVWGGNSVLRAFGLNPYNDYLFRVVWGPSRKWLVGGMWEERIATPSTNLEIEQNGRDNYVYRRAEYRWVQKYPDKWILERWLSPLQYGGTPESWQMTQWDEEAKLLTLGPYPERGEYEQCYTFDEEPSASAVERVVSMLVYGATYSYAERKQALEAEAAGKHWDWLNKCEAIWKDSQGAFNNQPTNVAPGKRTPDKVDLSKSAEEVGLPVGNKFFTR